MEALTFKDNEKFLRQISDEVVFPDEEFEYDFKVLDEYCKTHGCFAMAAVQLGIPKRIIYIKSTTEDCEVLQKPMVLINPVVISQQGRTRYYEACKSGGDFTALVERPYKMTLSYQDKNGNYHTAEFQDFICTILSHELDHLDGIFHMDRAIDLLIMTTEERIEFRKTHKYEILDKECEFSYYTIEKEKE